MSQGFRLRFDEMRESDPTAKQGPVENALEKLVYDQPGQMRNICFVWPNGRRLALQYAYMVSIDLSVEGEHNLITLGFTSETVVLKGLRLSALHTSIMEQRALYIIVEDARYFSKDAAEPNDQPVVLEIAITPKA